MTAIRSGEPGHDNGTAFIRPRQGKRGTEGRRRSRHPGREEKLAEGQSGERMWDNTAAGPYEVICPGCGDDPDRDWSEISAELRRIRGMYRTKEGAEAALMDHIGMQTR
jgi:hypothetical protein